ncbi:MAG TPA: hypothetical protein VHB27_12520 [Rhodopila sp.]|uniref:hypothetical protein n=1 Tax=Rhodopila sp. TaxID=2480087 RepID=UPI002D0221A8|nr:hypothetical protein [Rhodopila sp.]HVY16042.1 hypothetical protein [Rhodopila sp.]
MTRLTWLVRSGLLAACLAALPCAAAPSDAVAPGQVAPSPGDKPISDKPTPDKPTPDKPAADKPPDARAGPVDTPVTLAWTKPIAFPDWHFDSIGAVVEYYYGARKSSPIRGDAGVVKLPPGHKATVRIRDTHQADMDLRQDITGGDPAASVPVEPSRLQVNVLTDPPAQAGDDLQIGGTVGTGQAEAAWTSDSAALLVPPGDYHVTATVKRPSTGQSATAHADATIRYDEDATVTLVVPMAPPPPRQGRLLLKSARSGADPAELDLVLKDEAGNIIAQSKRPALNQPLDPGRYALVATLHGGVLPMPDIVIAPEATTHVDMFLPVGRLVLRIQHGGAPSAGDAGLVWHVRNQAATGPSLDGKGDVFDRTLPAGRYDVEVRADDRVTREVADVADGRVTFRTIEMGR